MCSKCWRWVLWIPSPKGKGKEKERNFDDKRQNKFDNTPKFDNKH